MAKRSNGLGIENAFGGSGGWAAAMKQPTDAEVRKNRLFPTLDDISDGIGKKRRR